MVVSKKFLVIIALCLVQQSLSKPTSKDEANEERGIFSSIWGWITYPFTWWNSSDAEQPGTEQLTSPTSGTPNDVTDVANPNTTVSCDDQTCSTITCDETKCAKVTCNIYDTNVDGECKEFNILPEELDKAPVVLLEPETNKPLPSETLQAQHPDKPSKDKPSDVKDSSFVKEKPLELEAILSSTVNDQDIKKSKSFDGTISEPKI